MNILLAVDGSAYTKRMLSYIAAHDELLGPRHHYTLLTVVMPVPPHAARYIDKPTLDQYYLDTAEEVLAPQRKFAEQQGWKAQALYRVGQPAAEVAAYLTTHPQDLVVMGTHGHTALAGAIVGSVATGVLASSSTPVLLVR